MKERRDYKMELVRLKSRLLRILTVTSKHRKELAKKLNNPDSLDWTAFAPKQKHDLI